MKNRFNAIIIAGGRGVRMGDMTREIPKPMLEVCGVPVLERQINLLKRYDVSKIHILTGYLGDVIVDYFGNGDRFDVDIEYSREVVPLGTAGCLKLIQNEIKGPTLVLYGDTVLDMSIPKFYEFHCSSGAIATLFSHPNDHPYDSDLVRVSDEGFIQEVCRKGKDGRDGWRNMVSAAAYIIEPQVLDYIEDNRKTDLVHDVFPNILQDREKVAAYISTEYIKDMGNPERIKEIELDIESGRVASRNYDNPQCAVFLDRDGVINVEMFDLADVKDFKLLPGVGDAIREINRSGYLAIVVTNQPLIAKGYADFDDVDRIHSAMDEALASSRAYIDDLYMCPHHPERGFDGERPELKVECKCRKPKPGMLLEAAARHNIDLSKSFMIGDRFVDIAAGKGAGCHTILLKTGYAGQDRKKIDIEPCAVHDDLNSAVLYILENDVGDLNKHNVDRKSQIANL
jgi:mannose-1-phosphate guanylyltransferase / phosphomannomutase